MIRAFAETAWEDYVYWQETDKNVVKKINKLLKEIERIPLIYSVTGDTINIAACRYHYEK